MDARRPPRPAAEPLFPTPGPAHVAEALARIVPALDPLRVVVFGSVARGDARPGSDLDLLVVLPDGTDRRAAALAVRGVLRDLDVPKDVVVTPPAHVAHRRFSTWHIVATALREGRTLYERPHSPAPRDDGQAAHTATRTASKRSSGTGRPSASSAAT